MKSCVWIAGTLIATFFSAPGVAQSDEPLRAELLAGFGVLNLQQDGDTTQWMGAAEYRFEEVKWNLRPWVGYARAEQGTNFISAGLLYTYAHSSGFNLSISWAPSYYDVNDGWDLGGKLNFYSFVEAGYTLKNDHVVSVRVGHLSNGGLGNRNPGTETLQLSYSVPFRQ